MAHYISNLLDRRIKIIKPACQYYFHFSVYHYISVMMCRQLFLTQHKFRAEITQIAHRLFSQMVRMMHKLYITVGKQRRKKPHITFASVGR